MQYSRRYLQYLPTNVSARKKDLYVLSNINIKMSNSSLSVRGSTSAMIMVLVQLNSYYALVTDATLAMLMLAPYK